MLTITEALAELNTIQKRIEKKRQFVLGYLTRPDGLRDPLEKGGGSLELIKRERQAIRDLENRHLSIRMKIQQANHATQVRIGNVSMSVAEWLTWRKETAPGVQTFLTQVRGTLDRVRQQAQQRGNAVVSAVATTGDQKPADIIVNVDEQELAVEAEAVEEVLGMLDGKLSLTNATVMIDV